MKEKKSLIWGLILIIIGLIFLGNNLGWFYLSWNNLWPLLMVGGGILFWFGWLTNRKESGLIMPGTILIGYGLLFLYCTLYGWDYMENLWQVFLLMPGLGFLLMYLLPPQHERGLLIPGFILTGMALIFWFDRTFMQYFWPLLLIGVGVYLLLKNRYQKKEGNEDITT